MPQHNWISAQDLALGDVIRFQQEIWDKVKKRWTGRSRKIQGLIVELNSQQVTISTSRRRTVKKIKTVERGSPERLERNLGDRQPTVWLAKRTGRKFSYCREIDPLARAIDMDDWRDEREERKEREREQKALLEGNVLAADV